MRGLVTIISILFFSLNLSAQNVHTDSPVEYPGGLGELRRLVSENTVYPEIALEQGITGKSYISFIIDVDGTCKDFQVKKGLPNCPDCDREAIRVLKLMQKWKPAKVNGKPVKTPYTIPVIFHLD